MKQKTIKKPALLLLFTLTLSFVLTGCATDFDASRYVKGCLDAYAHGEFTDYSKMTNVSEEDAKKQYDAIIDSEMASLSAYNLTDEKTEAFRELFINIYKNFKYEVGEATKNDDKSYSVPVTTYKLQIFKNFTEDAEAYLTDYYEKAQDAENPPTDDEIFEAVADFMYDYLSDNLNALEYDEAVTTTVTVSPTAGNSRVYSLSDSQLQDILSSLIDLENAQ